LMTQRRAAAAPKRNCWGRFVRSAFDVVGCRLPVRPNTRGILYGVSEA
jgi:hypothetical protein